MEWSGHLKKWSGPLSGDIQEQRCIKEGLSEKESSVCQNVRQSFQITNYKLLINCRTNMGYDQHIFSVI